MVQWGVVAPKTNIPCKIRRVDTSQYSDRGTRWTAKCSKIDTWKGSQDILSFTASRSDLELTQYPARAVPGNIFLWSPYKTDCIFRSLFTTHSF